MKAEGIPALQAAWTTGWLAGRAMASPFGRESHDHVEPGG